MAVDVTGDVELEKKRTGYQRIHVVYKLGVAADAPRETIERVHDIHKDGCPVYRSIHRAIDLTTELTYAPSS